MGLGGTSRLDVLLDDVIVISFIAGLYFKMDKFVKVSDSLVL